MGCGSSGVATPLPEQRENGAGAFSSLGKRAPASTAPFDSPLQPAPPIFHEPEPAPPEPVHYAQEGYHHEPPAAQPGQEIREPVDLRSRVASQDEEDDEEKEGDISDDESSDRITPEVLQQFVDFEKKIRLLEMTGVEEQLAVCEGQLANFNAAMKLAQKDLDQLKVKTEKEYQELVDFNIAQYLADKEMEIISESELQAAKATEEQQYINAKVAEDTRRNEIESLKELINELKVDIEKLTGAKAEIQDLRQKVDGLLEFVFNGEYGSDLEDRLELEVEQLLQFKQHVSIAHYKWWNGKNLIYHACSQLAYGARRWYQIQASQNANLQTRYTMVEDVRNNLLAASQNITRTKDYLKVSLPYFDDATVANLNYSVASVFQEVQTLRSYQRTLAWCRYYHWRATLLLNWMEQVINSKILTDFKDVSTSFNRKYDQLRHERLRCIKIRVKEVLNVDLDIDDLLKETEDKDEDVNIKMETVVSKHALKAQVSVTDQSTQDNMAPPPPEIDAESVRNTTEFSTQTTQSNTEFSTQTMESNTTELATQTITNNVELETQTTDAESVRNATEFSTQTTQSNTEFSTQPMESNTTELATQTITNNVELETQTTENTTAISTQTMGDSVELSIQTEQNTSESSPEIKANATASSTQAMEDNPEHSTQTTNDTTELATQTIEERTEFSTQTAGHTTGTEMAVGSDEPMERAVNERSTSPILQEDAQEQSSPRKNPPPAVRLVPLSELAPPPDTDQLFGNILELKELHRKQIEEFEKTQEVNKSRMQQGLRDKLRQRKSKRRRQQLHYEQEVALATAPPEVKKPGVAPIAEEPTA